MGVYTMFFYPVLFALLVVTKNHLFSASKTDCLSTMSILTTRKCFAFVISELVNFTFITEGISRDYKAFFS